SALMLLSRAAEAGSLPSLRAVVFAGEVYPTKHLRSLRSLVPDAALWNLYGPTETNVCTYYRVDELPEDDRPIPIGRACENTDVFALREDDAVAGVGEEGELYVRGSLVMKGYWGRPDRTAEVLVQNPVAPGVPELVYRTGDLVRLRPDGDYDFFGRRDHQVKSRGYRIELGEIEAALHAHPGILEAVAVAVPHEEWGKAIVAYVVPRDDASLTENEVKQHVARLLPRYMVPARVEVVSGLPRTSTGKADRTRLAEEASVGATS
ncbi:MAG: AMP-binding enzyme, partial [Actinomycetota bacterium]